MPSHHPPRPGKCVHCLKDNLQRTWDHVFPKAWYPDSTPPNLEKWQIPACLRCNQWYGKLEDDLLLRLGLCVNPRMAEAAGIAEKTLRALNPSLAKNAKDASHRHKRRLRFQAQLKPVADLPSKAVLPSFPASLSSRQRDQGTQFPSPGLASKPSLTGRVLSRRSTVCRAPIRNQLLPLGGGTEKPCA